MRSETPVRAGMDPIGHNYVLAVIEQHIRLAYAEIHPDEKDTTAAGVLR